MIARPRLSAPACELVSYPPRRGLKMSRSYQVFHSAIVWGSLSHFELVLAVARGIRTCLVTVEALALSQENQGVSMIFIVSYQSTQASIQLRYVSRRPRKMSRSQMVASAAIICASVPHCSVGSPHPLILEKAPSVSKNRFGKETYLSRITGLP